MKGLDWRYRLLATLSPFNPDLATMTDADRRRARYHRQPRWATGRPDPGVSTKHVEVPCADPQLQVRIDEPAKRSSEPLPLLVYIHGGAWMFCDMDTPEWLTTRLASATGAVVASLDYRLAPEHRFPAGLEDCCDALSWLAENASSLGADTERLAVMGDSAGGNLAAVLCLMVRDSGWPSITHQTLIYPALDLTLASPSIDTEGHHGMASRPQMEAVRELYIGEVDAADWRVSPLYAENLVGLPPAHIVVAEHDTLRDDGIRYAERLRACEVPVRLSSYAGMAHGFLALRFTPSARRRALDDIVDELNKAFNRP